MRSAAAALAAVAALATLLLGSLARHQHHSENEQQSDISLWIDQQQIKMLSGEQSPRIHIYSSNRRTYSEIPSFFTCRTSDGVNLKFYDRQSDKYIAICLQFVLITD